MRAFIMLLLLLSGRAVASEEIPLKNWPVAFDSLLGDRQVQATRPLRSEVNAVPSAASHFIATVPCRVLDTRNSGSPIPANSTRTVDVPGSGCGIPPGASAYSMSFTAMNPADNGYLTAYPTGSARPTTATMSYLAGGAAFDNAAIVPAGTAGAIDAYVAAQLHLIVDINGYFKEPVVVGVSAGAGLLSTGSENVTLSVNFAGSGSAGTVARSDHRHHVQTVIVSPAETAVSSGTALLTALAGITDASVTKPYLLKIEPGVYDLGSSSLAMKQFVDVEGSGETVTLVTATGGPVSTVIGASNAEIRFLTIENTGGGTNAIGLNTNNSNVRATHLTIRASGGTDQSSGVWLNGGTPELAESRVTASASGPALSVAIRSNLSSFTLRDITAAASGSNTVSALQISGGSATLENVTAVANGGTFGEAYAVNVIGFATVTMSDGSATASGGTSASGVRIQSSTMTLNSVRAGASGATNAYGMQTFAVSGGPFVIKINQSVLSGTTYSVMNDTEFSAFVGGSQLNGGPVSNSGTVQCAAVYDENYIFSANTCP